MTNKPRMRKLSYGKWVVRGNGSYGIGSTPEEAYYDYNEGRLNRMMGIYESRDRVMRQFGTFFTEAISRSKLADPASFGVKITGVE